MPGDLEAFSYRGGQQSKVVNKGQERVPAIIPYHNPGNPTKMPSRMKLPSGNKATILKQEFERFKDGGYRFL